MNNKSALLNRRTFLHGTGVALALPWFETFAAGSPKPAPILPGGIGLERQADAVRAAKRTSN